MENTGDSIPQKMNEVYVKCQHIVSSGDVFDGGSNADMAPLWNCSNMRVCQRSRIASRVGFHLRGLGSF